MPATRSLPGSRAQKARCRAGPGLWDVNLQTRKALSQEKAGARARSVFHGLPAPNTSFCTLWCWGWASFFTYLCPSLFICKFRSLPTRAWYPARTAAFRGNGIKILRILHFHSLPAQNRVCAPSPHIILGNVLLLLEYSSRN